MTQATVDPTSVPAAGQQLKRVLTTRDLTLYGLAMMLPIAPVAIYGVVTTVTQGHMAAAYILAMIAMAFTALSFGQMAGAFPRAGSTYTYTRHGLNQYLGLLGGWTILLDYMLMPIMSYVILALYGNQLFPAVNYWIWVLAAIAIATAVNLRGVNWLARVTSVLVYALLLVIVYFVISAVMSLLNGAGAATVFSSRPFYNPQTLSFSALIAGTAIACFSFLGFDAISTLAEETKDPARSVSVATILSLVLITGLFVLQAYLAQLVWPDFSTLPNLDTAFFYIAQAAGGVPLATVLTIAVIVAALANAIDASAGCSRLLFGMGRDRVIPEKLFGYLSPVTQTPVRNTLLLGVVAVLGATLGLETIISMINFGALLAFFLVNLSVIGHYYVKLGRRGPADTVRYLVAPAIGALVILLLWLNLPAASKIAGTIWLAIGIAYTAFTTGFFRKPLPELKEARL